MHLLGYTVSFRDADSRGALMKKLLILFCLGSSLSAAQSNIHIQDEAVMLDSLIAVTEDNLSGQRQLRSLVEKYRELEDLLLLDSDPKASLRHTGQLLAVASQMLSVIDQHELYDYFSRDFLDELSQLRNLTRRRRLSRP